MPDEKPVSPQGGRIHEQSFDATMAPMAASLNAHFMRELWEKSWPLLIPYVFITFLSPLLGLWLTGATGVVVGEGLAIVSLIIGFYAVGRHRVTETRQG